MYTNEQINEAAARLKLSLSKAIDAMARLKPITDEVLANVEKFMAEPEFKVGQYYLHSQIDLIRIIGVDKKHIEFQFVKSEQKDYFVVGSQFYCGLSLVTPQEIESNLRKIADEKYIGKKVKSLSKGWEFTYTKELWYDEDEDILHMTAKEKEWEGRCSDPAIYEAGKWAEILPSKKARPVTRDGFEKFVADWVNCDCRFSDFLDQYDFND